VKKFRNMRGFGATGARSSGGIFTNDVTIISTSNGISGIGLANHTRSSTNYIYMVSTNFV